MSIDRVLSLLNFRWKKLCRPKQAAFICATCVLIFLVANVKVLFAYGGYVNMNGTMVFICQATGEETSWMDTYFIVSWKVNAHNSLLLLNNFFFNFEVHSILYSYLPTAILVVTNFMLVYTFTHHRAAAQKKTAQKRQRSMIITVVLLTVLFIVMTLPGAIIGAIIDYIIQQPYGIFLISSFTAFSSSYNAYGIVILFFTNKKFRESLRSTIATVL